MKRIIKSSIVLVTIAGATGALAASFTAGDIVIYRLGGINADSTANSGNGLTNRSGSR